VLAALLVDSTGRFRVQLVGSATPVEPLLVHRAMAFRVGNLDVHGSHVHGGAAQGALKRGLGTLLYEDDFRIGDLPAKAVGWRRDGGEQAGTESHCIYVQTPWLVFQFVGRGDRPPTEGELAAMRGVVGTFEVVPPGA
jgi:hypothetical protein